jgi:hypothetical protein
MGKHKPTGHWYEFSCPPQIIDAVKISYDQGATVKAGPRY